MAIERPTYAIVSTDIRRDLIAPLRHFSRLQLIHYYRKASYGDLTPDDVDDSLIAYKGPMDLFRHFRVARPSVIQGVEPFSIRLLPYLYSVFFAALLQRVPLVMVTLENRPLAIKHGVVFSRLLRLALWPILGYARLIIYLNEGARRNVLSVGRYDAKLRKLMYGTWGVEVKEYTPQRDGREPDFGECPVILFVGRLHEEKGVFDLMDAFGSVKVEFPNARLLLVGEGPAREQIKRITAGRGWIESVLLTGTVKNRDLPPYFRAADLFAAPSITTRKWEEQVGMTNIQAMACGVPVVSTCSGAIPEYVPDGVAGLLVPEHNSVALAEAIVRLLRDDALRQKMGQAGREYCVEHYDAQKNVRRAEDLLLRLVERGEIG